VLDYVKAMLTELAAIARREKLDMLAYLVEMAQIEAADALARVAAPPRVARHRSARPRGAGPPSRETSDE
jgi:hypothetical protein